MCGWSLLELEYNETVVNLTQNCTKQVQIEKLSLSTIQYKCNNQPKTQVRGNKQICEYMQQWVAHNKG